MLPNKQSAAISESDLMMYAATGFKHLRLIALLLTFSLLLAFTYFLFSRSVYVSQAWIQAQRVDQPGTSGTLFSRQASDRNLIAILTGPEVTKRVAKRLGLPPSPQALHKHIKRIRITKNAERDMVVEVAAYSYPIVRDWAPVMLQEYLAYREERVLALAEATITNYVTQLSDLKEKLNQSVDSKYYFQQSNSIDKVLIKLNELRDIPKTLLVVRKRLSNMQHVRESLEDPERSISAKLALLDSLKTDTTARMAANLPNQQLSLNVGLNIPTVEEDGASTTQAQNLAAPGIIVLPSMLSGTESKPWEKLERDRAAIEQEMKLKGRTYLSGHPKMIELQRKLDEVDRQLELEYEIASNSFNIEESNLIAQKAQLEQKLDEYDEVNRQHEKMIKEYRQLDTLNAKWNSLYNLISQRLTTVEYGSDKDRRDFNFKGYLQLKNSPASPVRSKLMFYGIIFGLALAVGIPFLLEYLNTRISDIEHAEETLRIRGLGVVPKVIEVPFETLLLTEGTDKKDYHLKENFRLIRTNLIINSENAALPQVILVTSAMPQEGKTSVAANLALSFASKGEKTLLVDCDLRRGRAYKLFGCVNKPGMSNVLKDEVPLEEALRHTTVEHLTLLPCGKHLNSASELLDSYRFSNLMTELRSRYQRIIIDSPPVLGLSETIIIQRFTDGVMLVIWSDFTPMNSVKAAVQTLQVNGAKFLGFVLNRLDFSTLGNRYKYFYYAPLYYTNYQPLPAPSATSASRQKT